MVRGRVVVFGGRGSGSRVFARVQGRAERRQLGGAGGGGRQTGLMGSEIGVMERQRGGRVGVGVVVAKWSLRGG